MSRQPRIALVLLLIALTSVGAVAFFSLSGIQLQFGYDSLVSDLPSCGASPLTVSPANLAYIKSIVPLGNLNPPEHTFPTDHMYFVNPTNGTGNPPPAARVNVYAPGDIRIVNIRTQNYLTGNPRADYTIDFYPCRELRVYFDHITSLSDEILHSFSDPGNCQQYTVGQTKVNSCSKQTKIDLKAGDLIGTAGGVSGGPTGFDLGTVDSRSKDLAYANPSRYGPNALKVACPLDYFTFDLANKFKDLLISYDGKTKRTVEPVCGQVNQDLAGTAQGNWFQKGSDLQNWREDLSVALVHDNFDPSVAVFSIGQSTSSAGISTGAYSFTPESFGFVNRDFSQVKADGNIYCYESLSGRGFGSSPSGTIFLVQMKTDTSLEIEGESASSCGNGPWTFSSSAAFFER